MFTPDIFQFTFTKLTTNNFSLFYLELDFFQDINNEFFLTRSGE